NGQPIAGATDNSYTIAAVAAANNGELYSCVVSNFANSSPHTLASSSARLTVLPNRAPATQILYQTIAGFRNNYSGIVGTIFQTGDTPTLVNLPGFYSGTGSLNISHYVGIFPSNVSA